MLAGLALFSGCDEVNRNAFGGLKGAVGYPAVANCRVEIYNALTFQGLDSDAGRIATGRTNSAGRFSIELSNRHLGRPLILVARPDENALYRDFGAVGTPDQPFDAPRQPWVVVMNEWLGGESIVSINPITTIAFHSLMRLPTEQTGPATLRFDRNIVNGVHAATAANFGVRCNLGAENPAPPAGPMFAAQEPFFRERSGRSVSYTYAAMQLAKAANEFVNTTATPDDTALDFYEALFADAQDGVIDGMYFGEPVPVINQVPSLVGRHADGTSRLMRWISGQPLTSEEQGYAGAANDGVFSPLPETMLEIQQGATGALRPTRIAGIDVRNFPFSGNVELTVRGQGLRRTDLFVFRRGTDTRTDFIVDRNSVGVDGEFVYHSDSELRLRIPDFALTTRTVHPNLRVPSGADFRTLRLILQSRPEIIDRGRAVTHVLTTDARVTNRVEPLLVHAQVVRVNASGARSTSSGNNLYPDATDPAALDPASDNVYELRLRVSNPGPDAIDNLALDLNLSNFSQLGVPIVADVFGGSETDPAIIFENPLPSVNLAPGATTRLDYRFVFHVPAVPANLLEASPVLFAPILAGTSAGAGNPVVSTGDIVGLDGSAELSPVNRDATPLADAPVIGLPAVVTAGDSFEMSIDLGAVPQAGASMRSLRVTDVRVAITLDGESTDLNLADAFFETLGGSGLRFTALRLEPPIATTMPISLTQAAPLQTLVLQVQTDSAYSGTFEATVVVTGIDAATGAVSTQASAPALTTVAP